MKTNRNYETREIEDNNESEFNSSGDMGAQNPQDNNISQTLGLPEDNNDIQRPTNMKGESGIHNSTNAFKSRTNKSIKKSSNNVERRRVLTSELEMDKSGLEVEEEDNNDIPRPTKTKGKSGKQISTNAFKLRRENGSGIQCTSKNVQLFN